MKSKYVTFSVTKIKGFTKEKLIDIIGDKIINAGLISNFKNENDADTKGYSDTVHPSFTVLFIFYARFKDG